MNDFNVTGVLSLFVIIGIIFGLQNFLASISEKKKVSTTQEQQPEPENAAASQPVDAPARMPWVKITFLLLCIAVYAAFEYENGVLVITIGSNLPSSSSLFFLVPIIGSVVAYARLVFWVLITALSLLVFNNIVTMLFVPAASQNGWSAWKWWRHVAGTARPLTDEDFGSQTQAVEIFVRDGEKDALLKFLNTYGVASEWLSGYQKKGLSVWTLMASATLLLSLAFFLIPARDQYLAGLNDTLGNITISSLDTYQTGMIFAAVILLLTGFSVGTLCWAYIVKPIERFTGRRWRHNLVMDQSGKKLV